MKQILITSLILWLAQHAYSQNNCTVEVSGLKSSKGKCLIYTYTSKKGFPTTKYASSVIMANITDGACTKVLPEMPSGEYAILVIHDENDNGKMDTNFIGMPKEGIGTSNNTKSSLGPPSFEDSKFRIENTPTYLKITLKYL
jgi:uncharacterized protein (DUF2141 family)